MEITIADFLAHWELTANFVSWKEILHTGEALDKNNLLGLRIPSFTFGL